jgi:hypothetical protein
MEAGQFTLASHPGQLQPPEADLQNETFRSSLSPNWIVDEVGIQYSDGGGEERCDEEK